MPIEAGQKYDAVVLNAKATEARDGKPGVWVNFQLLGSDNAVIGAISKTIWLTPANRDRARKDLKTLGAVEAHVITKAGFREFYANVGGYLTGAECSITTKESEYEGRKRIEVEWINSRVKAASQAAIDRAEALFDDGAAAMSVGASDDNEPPPDYRGDY